MSLLAGNIWKKKRKAKSTEQKGEFVRLGVPDY
jgi:hypothetical protein